MSAIFSSALNVFTVPAERQAPNPADMCVASTPQRIMGTCSPKVIFGKEHLDKNRSEVFLTCTSSGFGHFIDELLNDFEPGLIRMRLPGGRTQGCLIFVGKGRTLCLHFDAHSPTIRKVLRDWKKHGEIQLTIKSDIWNCSFIIPLVNSILDKLLALKEDEFDRWPTKEVCEVIDVLHDFYSQSADVATTILIPCDEKGGLTIKK